MTRRQFALGLAAVAAACALLGAGIGRTHADNLTPEQLAAMAAQWQATYPVSVACVLAVANRETGGLLNPDASNGSHYTLFQFGRGEDSIWSLSRDWYAEHLQPWQVSVSETVRVFLAIVSEYPVLAAQAWAPFPGACHEERLTPEALAAISPRTEDE